MSGDVTIQALNRLTYDPNRASGDNGNLIAAQNYYDVYFTGGIINNAMMDAPTITDADISGGSLDGVTITNATFGAATFGALTATSLTLSTPLAGASGGTGVANTGKTITLGGNLVTSGAFNITLTTTALTNVTLPTTGTLSTLGGSETLSNKTLVTPVIGSIINTGTLTLPTSTDTLVGRATTDTLTNKTLTSPTVTSPTVTGGSLNNTVIGNTTATTVRGTTLTATTGVVTDSIQTSGSSGVVLKNSAGTTAASFGMAATTNASIVGGLTVGGTLGVTGAVTLTVPLAGTNIASATDTTTGAVEKATQAEMESQTADKYPDASLIKFNPFVAKAWVKFAGATGAIEASAGISSVTRSSAGQYTINFTTSFSSANYGINANILGGSAKFCNPATQAAGSCTIATFNQAGANEDQTSVYAYFYGDL
jgi:trimeric autotransporter adhesin